MRTLDQDQYLRGANAPTSYIRPRPLWVTWALRRYMLPGFNPAALTTSPQRFISLLMYESNCSGFW
jgi:hypothetical protein